MNHQILQIIPCLAVGLGLFENKDTIIVKVDLISICSRSFKLTEQLEVDLHLMIMNTKRF